MPKEIALPDGRSALVSDIDFDLDQYAWFINSKGYVIRRGDDLERMHRIVMARMIGRAGQFAQGNLS